MRKYLILIDTETDEVQDILTFDMRDYDDLGDMMYSFRKKKEKYESEGFEVKTFSEIN